MQFSRVASAVVALLTGASAVKQEGNPIAAVIQFIGQLEAKVTAEGEAEDKAYKEYFEWCDDITKEKNFEIETATGQKEKLEAKIKEAAAVIEEADAAIAELAAKISSNSDDLKEATSIREKEASEFAAAEGEMIETVDTLGRAIAVLEKELNGGSAAFAQVSNSATMKNALQALNTIIDAASFSVTDKKRLTALVQAKENSEDEDDDAMESAPAGAAYESKSGGILDVLGDMQEKAETQLADMRKAEQTAKANYELLKQGLTDQLSNDNKDMDMNKANKAKAEEGKATSEGDLSITKDELKGATDGLSQTQKGCMQVAADHEASIRSRNEELKAIAQATKILKAVMEGTPIGFLQTSASKKGPKTQITGMVKNLARKHHSAALAQLASKITAVLRTSSSDPFGKIKGMVQDMIAKLEQEAKEEATEQAYCESEMAKTKKSKGELEAEISKLSTNIDQAAARSAEIKEEVKEIQEELAALASEYSEAERVRKESHAVFVEEFGALQNALNGIRKALEVLRDYYAKGDGAALLQDDSKFNAFMQQPSPPAGHKPSGGAGGAIIEILEVAESDTAEEMAKIQTQEDDEQALFEQATQKFKVTKAAKDKDVQYKTQEFTALDKSITDFSTDRDTASTELAAVDEYWAKLSDRCVAKPEPYEERKKKREAEIAGLKEALTTLDAEAAFFQKGGKKRRSANMRGSLAPKDE